MSELKSVMYKKFPSNIGKLSSYILQIILFIYNKYIYLYGLFLKYRLIDPVRRILEINLGKTF